MCNEVLLQKVVDLLEKLNMELSYQNALLMDIITMQRNK